MYVINTRVYESILKYMGSNILVEAFINASFSFSSKHINYQIISSYYYFGVSEEDVLSVTYTMIAPMIFNFAVPRSR